MRVIAGQFRGVRLFTPKNNSIRPTTDRVREFIFAYLGDGIVDNTVLDLFAGTGAFGVEALSRGARAVTFIDVSFQALTLVKRNLQKTKASARIVKKSAETFLKYNHTQESYNIIFCDPPYKYDRFYHILELVRDHKHLAAHGLVIYESDVKDKPAFVSGFSIIKQKIISKTKITFYKLDG